MLDEATLADLSVGAEATVREVRCPRAVARRLMEMGVLPGTRVCVVRVAPLGDPIELWVRSYSLSIRRGEAAAIVVAPAEAIVARASRSEPDADRAPEVAARRTAP